MARFSVMLNGRGIRLEENGQDPQRGGFYVPCVVKAADPEAAREQAVAILRAHPRFQQLRCWPEEQTSDGCPTVVVDSVRRLPWWRWRSVGMSTGFILYPGPDETD